MRHIVWDWNGTLLDDTHLVIAATNASLASAGGGPVTAEEYRRDFYRPVDLYYGSVLGRVLDPPEFEKIDRAFHQTYDNSMIDCGLSAGAVEALSTWPGTQSLLSMWFHDLLVPTVERYGLTPYFERVDGLRDPVGGGRKGPHLAAHLAAMGRRGDEVVLIGDAIDDAAAAASVGADCVLYSGGLTNRAALDAVGVPVVDSLADAVAMIHGVTG